MMWKALIEAIVAAVLKVFFGRRDAAEQRQEDRAAGAQDAALETQSITGDVADEQARNNARRHDAHSVADSLRAEAERADRGSRSQGK